MVVAQRELGKGNAVLVTGGSGFVGTRLVRVLAQRRESVVSMYYHGLPEALPGVFPVCSDMSSAELLAAPLRGVDTVVHLAWESTFRGPPASVSWDLGSPHVSSNIRALRNLIQAIAKSECRRLVFVSALGASRDTRNPFLREKYLGEVLVLNSDIPEKIIVRPGVVTSGVRETDRFVQTLQRYLRLPGIYPVPAPDQNIAPLDVQDLAEMLADLCRVPLRRGAGIVEAVGGQSYSVSQLFKLVSESLGLGSRMGVGGVVGRFLTPILERERRGTKPVPKLGDYLALGAVAAPLDADLSGVAEESVSSGAKKGEAKRHSFRDTLVSGARRQAAAGAPPTNPNSRDRSDSPQVA